MKATMARDVDQRLVILDIDEKSLGEIGRWPWNRRLMAELVDKLFDKYGVAVLGFDVVWAEPDPSSGMATLDSLARGELKGNAEFQRAYGMARPQLDFDRRFAASMKDRPVVLGYYFNFEERAVKANALPTPVLPKGTFDGRRVFFSTIFGYTGNLPVLLENAAGSGHINPRVDFDGVVRRIPLIVEYDGEYYEALSLAMARALLARLSGNAPPALEPGFPPDDPNLEWLRIGALQIPVDAEAAALVPYRPRGSFRYVSLVDVLKDRVPPEALKGRIALVGTTAPGLQDMRATPIADVYPGVEVHANMLAGILSQEVKQRPLYVVGAEVVLLLIGGIAFAFLIPRLSALWATLGTAAGIGLITGFNFMVWQNGLVLPLAASVLIAATIYVFNMAYGYFVESRSKRRLAGRFAEYVPPKVVEQMELDPDKYDRPTTADLSILFADVRGFTGISETLTPDALRDYINEYLTEMSRIIFDEYRGTLDKYIGDAIMAFWGAPVEDAQHARNAVLAALAMQRHCRPLNQRFAARGWPVLRIGIGVNSGTVRVGNMGSRLRRAYTAMGDAVNVASRLEGRTKGYGVGILVGEATRNRVQDVVFREIDRVKVKGKDEAITIYEPLGLESETTVASRELGLWEQALRAYRAQEWFEAEDFLVRAQAMNPGGGLYEVYLKRIQDRRGNPPPRDWDGVTVFDEK